MRSRSTCRPALSIPPASGPPCSSARLYRWAMSRRRHRSPALASLARPRLLPRGTRSTSRSPPVPPGPCGDSSPDSNPSGGGHTTSDRPVTFPVVADSAAPGRTVWEERLKTGSLAAEAPGHRRGTRAPPPTSVIGRRPQPPALVRAHLVPPAQLTAVPGPVPLVLVALSRQGPRSAISACDSRATSARQWGSPGGCHGQRREHDHDPSGQA
jgi:hypothetical protein